MEILSESERVGAGRWNWLKRITFNRWQHRYQLEYIWSGTVNNSPLLEASCFILRGLHVQEKIAEDLYGVLKIIWCTRVVEILEVPSNENLEICLSNLYFG